MFIALCVDTSKQFIVYDRLSIVQKHCNEGVSLHVRVEILSNQTSVVCIRHCINCTCLLASKTVKNYLYLSFKWFDEWWTSHCLCLHDLIIQCCLYLVDCSKDVYPSISVLCCIKDNYIPIINHFLHRLLQREFLRKVEKFRVNNIV